MSAAPWESVEAQAIRPGIWSIHRHWILSLAGAVAFLALWQVASQSGWVNATFVPPPTSVAQAFIELARAGTLGRDALISGYEYAAGFSLAVGAGIVIGTLIGCYDVFASLTDSVVSAFYATPRVALLPVIVLLFGVGTASKVVIVFLAAVFPILINTAAGLRNVDPQLVRAARSFGAGDGQLFRTVSLPAAVPFVLTGLRLGVGSALIGVVVGELYAANAGIGYLIAVGGQTLQMAQAFVGIVVIAAAGIVFMAVLQAIERRFDGWRSDR